MHHFHSLSYNSIGQEGAVTISEATKTPIKGSSGVSYSEFHYCMPDIVINMHHSILIILYYNTDNSLYGNPVDEVGREALATAAHLTGVCTCKSTIIVHT